MFKTVAGTVAGVAGAVGVIACGGSGPPAEQLTPAGTDSVTVEVINRNFADVNIWARYQGNVRDRLGLVQGNTADTFRIAWSPRPLIMLAEFVAGRGSVSNDLDVDPGDFVTLELLPGLDRRVRRRP